MLYCIITVPQGQDVHYVKQNHTGILTAEIHKSDSEE